MRLAQLILGHPSVQRTQRYLSVTDDELMRGGELENPWAHYDWRRELDRRTRDARTQKRRDRVMLLSQWGVLRSNVVAGAGFEPATFGL